jgi:probable F420-dependent oxidoreductase
MRDYLSEMAATTYQGAPPPEKPKTLLAALGPKMLEISAAMADGAHPYNVTPEHTAGAREILGPEKSLCPAQFVLLETDPAEARRLGRETVGRYFGFPNYVNSFRRLGFTEDDFAGGGSDRLVDAVVAWGDEDAIRRRIQEHWDAGADHVAVQTVARSGLKVSPEDERVFELLAQV